jgi:hypothetical protein
MDCSGKTTTGECPVTQSDKQNAFLMGVAYGDTLPEVIGRTDVKYDRSHYLWRFRCRVCRGEFVGDKRAVKLRRKHCPHCLPPKARTNWIDYTGQLVNVSVREPLASVGIDSHRLDHDSVPPKYGFGLISKVACHQFSTQKRKGLAAK